MASSTPSKGNISGAEARARYNPKTGGYNPATPAQIAARTSSSSGGGTISSPYSSTPITITSDNVAALEAGGASQPASYSQGIIVSRTPATSNIITSHSGSGTPSNIQATNQVAQQLSQGQIPTIQQQNARTQAEAIQRDQNYTLATMPTQANVISAASSVQDKTLAGIWGSSGMPISDKITQSWNILTGNKGTYQEAKEEADYLRRGRETQFGGVSYFELNPVQKRGTASITSIPFETEDIVTMVDFTGGAGIILGERQQREFDILGFTTAKKIESELIPKYQGQVTSEMSQSNLNKLNEEFEQEFKTQFATETKPIVSKVTTKYKDYYSTLENTQIEAGLVKALPAASLVTLGFATLPLAVASTAGIVIGGATIASTLSTPSSFNWIYEPPKIDGGVGGVSQQYTKTGTLNLAMGGLAIGAGAFGSIKGIEQDMFKLETTRLAEQNKIVQPYFEQRFTSPNLDFGFTKAKIGSMEIGQAQTDIFSTAATVKKGGSFSFAQDSVVLTRAELSWNYPQGNKFISMQVSGQTGKGVMLPSEIEGKGFSFFNVEPKFNIGTSAVFKDFGKLPKMLESNVKSFPIQETKFYFGESTKLKEGSYFGKTYNLKGLYLDTTGGKFNWAALTGDVQSKGFTKILEIPKERLSPMGGGRIGGTGAILENQMRALNFKISPVEIQSSQFERTTTLPPIEDISIKMNKRNLGIGLGELEQAQFKRTSTSFNGLQRMVGFNKLHLIEDLRINTITAQSSAQALSLQQQQSLIQGPSLINGLGMSMAGLGGFGFPSFIPIIGWDIPSLGGFAIPNYKGRGRKSNIWSIAPSFGSIVQNIKMKSPLKVSASFGVTPFQTRGLLTGKAGKGPYFKLTDI